MAEDKKTLTLWDFYDTDRQFEGGLVIDDRPGAGIYDHLKYLDEEGRERFIRTLPEDFVAGFDLSLLPPVGTAA